LDNADFEEGERLALPRMKMALVDRKIMHPLVDDLALIDEEILPEVHGVGNACSCAFTQF
jgi:hypothetical protein